MFCDISLTTTVEQDFHHTSGALTEQLLTPRV